MFGTMGDPPARSGSLMPPATTRRLPERPAATTRESRIAPPYVPAGAASSTRPIAHPTPQIEVREEVEPIEMMSPDVTEPAESSEPRQMPEPVQSFEPAEAFEPAELMGGPSEEEAVEEPVEEPVDDRWNLAGDEEGVVEPAFGADTDAVLEELTQHASELARREEFPMDAFIVPEQSQRVPTGLEGMPSSPNREPTVLSALAERLEKLSHRLRVEETDAVVRRLAAGDRLDALLAGLLAGYLAGKSEQS